MTAFLGSWFIAWLLGGGLILAVILYFVFFKKNSLMIQAMRGISNIGLDQRTRSKVAYG